MSVASSIIGGFVNAQTNVCRGSAPLVVKGVVSPGPTTTVQILAAILPASSTDLARSIEGERLRDLVVIYSADEVFSGNEATGAPADLVEHAGALYEVEDVDPFPGGLYQAKARKKVQS